MITRLKEVSNKFSSQLDEIEASNPEIMDCANSSIILCRQTLHELKNLLLQGEFKTVENEIEFFKSVKQTSIIPLIYYSEIRSFELQFPIANSISQKKYTNKKISKLNHFFNINIGFERGSLKFSFK